MSDNFERHGESDRRHYSTNGNKPVLSTNDAVRYAILLVAIVTFAITIKNNQDSANTLARERQARTEKRLDELSDSVDKMRSDINEWKRATTELVFKRKNGRPLDDEEPAR